jgi:hypothetical protein
LRVYEARRIDKEGVTKMNICRMSANAVQMKTSQPYNL